MPFQHGQQLQQILQDCRYSQIAAAKTDATSVMSHYSDLKPTRDLYRFPNGAQKYLLCIAGTIPVSYKGAVYNIPIAIFMMDSHPAVAPFCFVRPTATMQVRQGRNVDSSGKIYLPYLSEWKQASHNLTSLVQIMAVVFGESPPVVSTAGAERPPYPGSNPPYPSNQHGYPRGPPSTLYQPGNPPYPMASPSHPGYPVNQQSGYAANPPYPPSAYLPPQGSTPYPSNTTMQQQISSDMIKTSLMSAVNDKLKRRMRDAHSQAESELSSLKQTEEDLRKRQDKLKGVISKLEDEVAQVDLNIDILTKKNREMEDKVEQMQGKQEELDVDEVVFPSTPLYKQILEAFAEEQALEDAIFYLGEALRKESVDLESFLKHVRSLSRQQFLLTVTIKKARNTAQLANIY